MTVDELQKANKQIGEFLLWEGEAIKLFQTYAQKFGCPPAGNVYRFVLEDALRFRKTTLARFMARGE